MNKNKAAALADKVSDDYLKQVYQIISEASTVNINGDSNEVSLSSNDCERISSLSYNQVQANYASKGIAFESLDEVKKGLRAQLAGDQIVNPKNKIGTLLDPSVYTHAQMPIMLGPWESSAVYANGGLPTIIIDKKARAMVLHGASFKSENKELWDTHKLELLEEAAEITGFNEKIVDASADSFIYGGSILYPVFKRDTPHSYRTDIEKMGLQKGCIDRWVSTDRWNTVVVPSYIVTARDYLRPKTIFIPQSSLEISTSRVAMIRPRAVPYWVSLYNIGWAPSDMSGWLRTYYGYEIVCQSIPVMAQQMSLVLYKMPLDALNATIGPNKVRELMEINEEKMSEWSALSPKAVNMVGDVEVVDRTYSGFEQFVGAMKSNLSSQCGLPEPTLWHTPNKGFSDNTTESLLKQSEILQMSQHHLETAMSPCTHALIAHVFGTEGPEWEHRNELKMVFNKPIISTEKDLAEVGARFAASVSSFVNAGVSPDTALELSAQFFPTVKITDELLSKAKASYEQVQKMQFELGQQKMQMGQPQGNVKGKATTTGSFTKAK